MSDREEAEAAERAYWAERDQRQAEFAEAIAVLKAELLRPAEIVLGWLMRLFGGKA